MIQLKLLPMRMNEKTNFPQRQEFAHPNYEIQAGQRFGIYVTLRNFSPSATPMDRVFQGRRNIQEIWVVGKPKGFDLANFAISRGSVRQKRPLYFFRAYSTNSR